MHLSFFCQRRLTQKISKSSWMRKPERTETQLLPSSEEEKASHCLGNKNYVGYYIGGSVFCGRKKAKPSRKSP